MRLSDLRRRTEWCQSCLAPLRPGHGERCARFQARRALRRRLQFPLSLGAILGFAALIGSVAR